MRMRNSKIYILISLLFLLVYSISATSVQILDPINSTLTREEGDKIMVTYKLDGNASTCWYTHYNTPEVNIPLNCSAGINEISTEVIFSGLHSFEIYLTGTDGKITSDLVQFTVIKDKHTDITPPVNLDTISCIDIENCLWDNQEYLTVFFAIAVIGLIIYASKEM